MIYTGRFPLPEGMPTNTVEPEVFNGTTSRNMMHGWTYFGIFGDSKSWQPQYGQCLEALWLQCHACEIRGWPKLPMDLPYDGGNKHPIASYCRVLRVPGCLIHSHMFLSWLLEKWNTDSIMGVRWCKFNIGRFIVSNQKSPAQWDCNHQPRGHAWLLPTILMMAQPNTFESSSL